MELPIELLRQVDEFVVAIDSEYHLTDRQVAIREAARLLVYLTHDEHYGKVDPFDESYSVIATACACFME